MVLWLPLFGPHETNEAVVNRFLVEVLETSVKGFGNVHTRVLLDKQVFSQRWRAIAGDTASCSTKPELLGIEDDIACGPRAGKHSTLRTISACDIIVSIS